MANHIAGFVFLKNRNIFANGARQKISNTTDLPVGQITGAVRRTNSRHRPA
jgi:hypothetical protein